ncbi:MAG: NAD(P)/FAD-dependent oxidoreductase [Planctomycetota bacterium]
MRPLGRIAIVGAGMSGLAAAMRLQNAGARVVVFDKGRGPGGRMSTRRHGDYSFDHGAPYFTVSDARFQKIVDQWTQAGAAEVWGAPIAVVEGDRRVDAAGPGLRYVGTPGMNAVVASLGSELDVCYDTRVEGLRRETDHWTVLGNGGGVLGACDTVLVSIPPAQALSLLAPAAPAFKGLASAAMAPCWAVMAAFDRPIRLPFEAAMIRESPLSWAVRDASKPKRPEAECWVLHASAKWSARHLESGTDHVCGALLEALSKAASTGIPEPVFTCGHRWRYSRAERPLGVDSLWDPGLALGICGDWCLGARVEAAYLSGLSLADRVIGGQ